MLSAIFGDGNSKNAQSDETKNGETNDKPGKENNEAVPEDDWEDAFDGDEGRGRKAGGQDEADNNNLRTKDVDEIYRSVSRNRENESEKPPSKSRPKAKSSRSRSKIAYGNEDAKTVGNAWSPFNWYGSDKREKRYGSTEEEEKDKDEAEKQQQSLANGAPTTPNEGEAEEPAEDGEDEADPLSPTSERNHNRSHSYRSMFGNSNNNNNLTVQSSSTKRKRAKPRFFRNKGKAKPRGGRGKSIYCIEDDADEEDSEYFTGIRAQQLIGSLAAGSPAINILASCLLEDERGIARAPLLLSLLGLKVSDTSFSVNTKNRKFKLDLEYGVGEDRLRWSVERSASDLIYLHSRFKFDNWRSEVVRSKNSELPRVPIPQLRKNQKEKKNQYQNQHAHTHGRPSFNFTHTEDNHIDNNLGLNSNTRDRQGEQSANHLSPSPNSHQGNSDNDVESLHSGLSEHLNRIRTYLSNSSSVSESSPEKMKSKLQRNQEYINQVSKYLNDLINNIALKPQSNRLFQFFEISPISSLLSYETGFQGKQGVIHIGGTTRTQGWRVGHFKATDLKGIIDRRQEKWLLIRNTYLMYVSDINSTLPLEVFLVDPKFEIKYKGRKDIDDGDDEDEDAVENYDDSSITQKAIDKESAAIEHSKNKIFKHLKITLRNSERSLTLIPKSKKEQKLWIQSLEEMKSKTPWAEEHRFGSFAPVRDNCFAQWFVDGRDYFWAVSSALEMAKDVIFIHDWWLSPELYLRRPANGNQQWRIDRILQRKAKQGIKIFVIVYRNVGTTVATDSLYTKHSILSLDEENIHVIRSPNQLLQNTYFWAHHEKLCIIDQTVAFLGGIDLCYGRFDTPDHVLVDDSDITFDSFKADDRPSTEDHIKFQTFPGKDYSNPRVKDFFGLEKPYESMYDREAVPRMPWHDVHMVTSGKVASDLARHFVQRWNYLIRQKRPSRLTPLLTPPPDFSDEEIEDLGIGGSCEVQLLRSSCNWSLGLTEHEQSIQNAYLKLIETSEHFVYIENQFFITSCVVDGTEIRNRIGDALVDRIIRAHREGTNWRAVIVIPLMPGFESQVDEPEGSSVRVIMQCQYMSISRGATSIFAKLKKYGIEPDDYIQFFSLRKWGIIGPDRTLVTEQLYIHAKTMIVDDRAAIIGSANINERSMRGVRDSEVAAVVRDKETVKTLMHGEPYLAGKFAHTLRMRLMREHLGVNVDILEIIERRFKKFELYANTSKGVKAATGKFENSESMVLSAMVEIASRDILGQKKGTKLWHRFKDRLKEVNEDEVFEVANHEEIEAQLDADDGPTPLALPISFNNRTGPYEANKGIRDKKKHSYDARVQQNSTHKKDVAGYGPDMYKSKAAKRARLNSSKFLRELAQKAMLENPTGIFLPHLDEVENFLESDDADVLESLSKKESEEIIAERNRERWLLLKKISYMQRTAAKEKEQKEEETRKRNASGLDAYSVRPSSVDSNNGNKNSSQKLDSVRYHEHGNSSNGNLGGNGYVSANGANLNSAGEHFNLDNGQKVSKLSSVQVPDSGAANNATVRGRSSSSEDSVEKETGHTGDHEDIPIITLSEEGVTDLMQGINPKAYENFSTFVDPYAFEDPLDDEFYEDLWFEHARRNTEIYRMIFHTQPDDFVATWKDYKKFSKLQSAFLLAQKQEAKYYRQRSKEKAQFGSYGEDDGENSSSDSNSLDSFNRKSVSSIKMHSLNDVGLLGHPPQEPLPTADAVDGPPNKKKFRRRFSAKEIIKEEREKEKEKSSEADEIEQNHKDGDDGVHNNDHENDSEDQDNESVEEFDSENTISNGQAEQRNGSQPSEESGEQKLKDRSYYKRQKRRRRTGTFTTRRKAISGDRIYDRITAERILNEIQGHLVFFPADWLMSELEGGNWFYNTDRIPPIEIYD